ncbi:BA75_03271T0 [Komagataella pastoris]|uniref:glucan endo-1,3-beta-D-glucosidase n=1 Tax=Komagataella pastoris TaxID=4922 RepID=A0A1B2JDS6_PICPA|nr:BA75_03271T0 [Komagataella pastoris]
MGLLEKFKEKTRTKSGRAPNHENTEHQSQTPLRYNRPPLPLPNSPNNTSGNLFSENFLLNQDVTRLFPVADRYPVPLPPGYSKDSSPLPTNSFYETLLLEDHSCPVWTHPYSLWIPPKDMNRPGLAFNHVDDHMKVFGPENTLKKAQFFFSPVAIVSLCLSAMEFSSSPFQVSVTDTKKLYCHLTLSNGNGAKVTVPIIQGMAFVSAVYENSQPKLYSNVGFRGLSAVGTLNNGMKKYLATLNDNTVWSLYVSTHCDLQLNSPEEISSRSQGPSFQGQTLVQIAKLDSPHYDETCGNVVTGMHLYGDSSLVQNETAQTGTYGFNFDLLQPNGPNEVAMWTLPHQYSVLSCGKVTDLSLNSTVKGPMRLVRTSGKPVLMTEQLPPPELQFAPWTSLHQSNNELSKEAHQEICRVARSEFAADRIAEWSCTESMYTSGKILDKAAYQLYVLAYEVRDRELTLEALKRLEAALSRFVHNKQPQPLFYEPFWKGIVSGAGLDGNIFVDYGNTHYNDHHFHYGYHIHAAALLVKVDKEFDSGQREQRIRPWVEALLSDVATPIEDHSQFPQFRSFDWFHGHSWATGLFARGDGKDEESSSEDYNMSYALYCWGLATGNKQLIAMGRLMLGVQRHSVNSYMLYSDDNKIMPKQFVGNKVSGILFENKIDHTTYFGQRPEYIHGIHMLPLTPISSFIRSPRFCKEEWDQRLGNEFVSAIPEGGWKGLLTLSTVLFEPEIAYNFFVPKDFDPLNLDNGMSQSWSLLLAAHAAQK